MALVERENHSGGATHNLLAFDRAVEAGVEAVIAIIAHHEVFALRHDERSEIARCGRGGITPDGVRLAGELFAGEDAAFALRGWNVTQQFLGDGLVCDGRAVEDELIVAEFDGVAGQADDAFDETRAVVRREEHHDVTPLRVAPFGEVPCRERHFEIVGEFVHKDAVAFENGRAHRTARHIVPIRERGADGEEDQRQNQQRADFFAPKLAGTSAKWDWGRRLG